MKLTQTILTLGSLALLLWACSDDDKGFNIGAPALRPPVENATPGNLKGGQQASLLNRISSLIPKAYAVESPEVVTLKENIFLSTGNGPLHIFQLIENVDERMASLNNRALESARKCLTETPQAFTFPEGFKFPHDASYSFDLFFQCHEELSSELDLAFGIKDSKLYLMEVQNSATNFRGAVFAKSDIVTEETEIWILSAGGSAANETNNVYIKSTKGTGIKFAVGGHTQNNGTTCGLKLAASDQADRINILGVFDDSLNAGDCSVATTDICVSASDLSQDQIDCGDTASTSLAELPELNYSTIFGAAPPAGVSTLSEFNDHARALIDSLIINANFAGLTDFNTDASSD